MLFRTKTRFALTMLCSQLMIASSAHSVTTFDLDVGLGPGLSPQTIAPGSPFDVSILMTVDGTANAFSVSVDLGGNGTGSSPLNLPVPFTVSAGTPACASFCGSFAALSFTPIPPGTYTIGTFSFLSNGSSNGLPLQLGFLNPGVDFVFPNDEIVVFNPLVVVPEPTTACLLMFGLGFLGSRTSRRSLHAR